MRFPDELNRTEPIKEYDRSRRWVLVFVVAIVLTVAGVSWFLMSKANRYFWVDNQEVHDAYVWAFWTPLIMIMVIVVLFLLAWYTPMLRPVRRSRIISKARKLNRKAAKIQDGSPSTSN